MEFNYPIDYTLYNTDEITSIIKFLDLVEECYLSGVELSEFKVVYKEFIKEASRVGKDKIIIKAHFRDNIFEKYNFTRIIRKNTKFHFGFLEINKKTKN